MITPTNNQLIHHNTNQVFLSLLRIYLALTVQCVKENDQAITEEDGITVACPLISHSLIDDVSVTIGESTLDRQSQVSIRFSD